MSTQQIISKAYWVWYIAAALVLVIALGSAMEGQAWWKIVATLLAYVSLVWGAGCWFCRRSRETLQRLPDSAEQSTQQPPINA